MDASEYKQFIFGVLFLKRASDLFDQRRAELEREYRAKGMPEAAIATQLINPDKYQAPYFWVPETAHWSKIRHFKENVGSALNKALEDIEEANIDVLQDVLKGGINFNRKIGQRTLDDETLSNFIPQRWDKCCAQFADQYELTQHGFPLCSNQLSKERRLAWARAIQESPAP